MVLLMLSNIPKLLNTLHGFDYACFGCVQGDLKEITANQDFQRSTQYSPSLLKNLRCNSNSLNLEISQYCKPAWLTNNIEMCPISLVHKIGWGVHPLHLANVKPGVICLQASQGEGHIVLAGGNVALNDLFHKECFKLHGVRWSTNFCGVVTSLFKQSHSNFLCIPNVFVFTHQAGNSLPVGQHHCWLSHFHYCKEVKSVTVSELSRKDPKSFTSNLHSRKGVLPPPIIHGGFLEMLLSKKGFQDHNSP